MGQCKIQPIDLQVDKTIFWPKSLLRGILYCFWIVEELVLPTVMVKAGRMDHGSFEDGASKGQMWTFLG